MQGVEGTDAKAMTVASKLNLIKRVFMRKNLLINSYINNIKSASSDGLADHTIFIPQAPELLSPILEIVPLQLFAYYVAAKRGLDVDRPRNLVKAVTLE